MQYMPVNKKWDNCINNGSVSIVAPTRFFMSKNVAKLYYSDKYRIAENFGGENFDQNNESTIEKL